MPAGARPAEPGRLHFLDGARGWAAVAVAFGHLELWLRPVAARQGYGWLHDLLYTSPLGLAVEVAVTLFFIISGFALSYPILTSKNPRRTLRNMACYRYFRLTLPILAACLLAYALWRAGGFCNAKAGALSGSDWFAGFYRFTDGPPTVLRFSLFDVYFGYLAPRETWDPVLWTMSIELIGSLALFAVLATVPAQSCRIALALAAAFALVASAHAGLGQYVGNYFGFPAGYLAAEFAVRGPARARRHGAVAVLLFAGGLAFGIFSITPLLPPSLNRAIDPQCAMNLCAFMLFAGLLLSSRAQALLAAPISKFMGSISFALYLTHFLMLSTIGAAVYVTALQHDWTESHAAMAAAAAAAIAYFSLAAGFNVIVENLALARVKRTLIGMLDRIWLNMGRPARAAEPGEIPHA